jgi:DNA-binding NtrC family response regulator
MDHDWPGNVRELENAVERAVVVSKGNIIKPDDLPGRTHLPGEEQHKSNLLSECEKNLIIKVLDRSRNNLSKAAKELGISRSTLYGKLKRYDINI